MLIGLALIAVLLVGSIVFVAAASLKYIGPTEIGLPIKRFGTKLTDGSVIALRGEAGYQAELMMPGWRFRLWPVFRVVIAQIGEPLPIGAKSAEYKEGFGDFRDVRAFLENGGQKGVQRPVLPP